MSFQDPIDGGSSDRDTLFGKDIGDPLGTVTGKVKGAVEHMSFDVERGAVDRADLTGLIAEPFSAK